MTIELWCVYICPECYELNVYPGACDNRKAHSDPLANHVLVRTLVKRSGDAPSEDALSLLQQSQGVQAPRDGEP